MRRLHDPRGAALRDEVARCRRPVPELRRLLPQVRGIAPRQETPPRPRNSACARSASGRTGDGRKLMAANTAVVGIPALTSGLDRPKIVTWSRAAWRFARQKPLGGFGAAIMLILIFLAVFAG